MADETTPTDPTPPANQEVAPIPPVQEEVLSIEEIDKHYAAAMDSVNLINGTKPEPYTEEEWADCLKRNKEHLKIMLSKTFWTTHDLTPFRDAVE